MSEKQDPTKISTSTDETKNKKPLIAKERRFIQGEADASEIIGKAINEEFGLEDWINNYNNTKEWRNLLLQEGSTDATTEFLGPILDKIDKIQEYLKTQKDIKDIDQINKNFQIIVQDVKAIKEKENVTTANKQILEEWRKTKNA